MEKKRDIILSYIKKCFNFIAGNRTLSVSLLTLLIFISSLVVPSGNYSIERETSRLKKQIHNREKILEQYAVEALEYPVDQVYNPEDFPSDMVIYKYNADTIQSWVNQFPINNDEVDVLPLWHRLNYFANTTNLYSTPLAYLSEKEQYVNLGSAWYVVKVYRKGQVKVISGLLVKTDYIANNSILVSRINPELKVKRELNITPVNFDTGIFVEGRDGEVLFSVIEEIHPLSSSSDNTLKWLSFLFAFIALFSYFYSHKTVRALWLYIAGITLLRIATYIFGNYLRLEMPLFSPNIYADKGIFSSLGNLLFNNLYVFFVVQAVFMVRRKIVLFYKGLTDSRIKGLFYFAVCSAPIFVVIYIHLTLCSLIMNSNIMFELYMLNELNLYTILCYISYGMLFVALLMLLHIALPYTRLTDKSQLFKTKYLFIYIFSVSLYTIAVVSYLGYSKEMARSRVWTNKLSVERDLGLELQLRNAESKLPADPIVKEMLGSIDNEIAIGLLQNRLDEMYFQGITQKYEISLTICRPNESLLYNRGQRVVDCDSHYQRIIYTSGSNISDKYLFFFLNNYNGRVSYLGIFRYETKSGPLTLYIEINSRFFKDVIGYSSILFDSKQANTLNMPTEYSYAKYIHRRLIMYRGNYNYPMYFDHAGLKEGFTTFTSDGSRHFINKFSEDNIIVISRPKRNIFDFFISYSYLVLFFSAIIFIFLRARRLAKRTLNLELPKNLFRRKITYLIIFSLVISLVCLGVGSVWFSLRYYNTANRLQMEERLLTVQSTLSDHCKYKESYTEINTLDFSQLLERMSNNTQTDINIYDPHGRLIKSTLPDLFDCYLLSSRMNSRAYYQLVNDHKRQVINNEKIAELSYVSLYAPIFNADGKVIAYVNIPYFNRAVLWGDVSSVVAVIINIYILFMMAAIFVGTLLANSISKPLAEISRKMKRIDVSKKTEHINYKNNDELGALVGAYNKMVEDLEESTKRLAQTEREHAWSEMARQIAHEIKNPLTPMRLSIQHLIRLKNANVEEWEKKFQDVANSILEQIDILSNTASEFSSFAKFYYEENAVLNLCSIIAEQKILFDTRDSINIIFNPPQRDCIVYARKGQIIRVVVNLLSNAIQALESDGNSGYIRISVLQKNSYYIVSFEDNGPGVKPEDIDKLFKPNFTTKSSGTGLGLAICRNIIEQSGGTISYSTSELGGANFSFTLPVFKG